MNKLLLGSMALATTLAGPAVAADMPVKAPPPPPAFHDWSGAYSGLTSAACGTMSIRRISSRPATNKNEQCQNHHA